MIAASGVHEYPASRRISAVRLEPSVETAVEVPIKVSVEVSIEIPIQTPIKPLLIVVPVIVAIDPGGVVTGPYDPAIEPRRQIAEADYGQQNDGHAI
jgi:hypothetical protein